MQPGEIIANTFAAVLVVCGLAIIFLVAGRPLFPRRQARMVLMMPADLTLHEATKTWVISKKRRMHASGAAPRREGLHRGLYAGHGVRSCPAPQHRSRFHT